MSTTPANIEVYAFVDASVAELYMVEFNGVQEESLCGS